MTKALAARLRELRSVKTAWISRVSYMIDGTVAMYGGKGTDELHSELFNALPAILTALEGAEEMREALTECEDYFSDTADAEYLPGISRPIPNRSMRLLEVVRAALKEKP